MRRILQLTFAMARRSRSAPARVHVPEDNLDGSAFMRVANANLSNSNGAGGASPTLWTSIPRIRSRLMNTMLFFVLIMVICLSWPGEIYAGVYWNPRGSPYGCIRPWQLHTTLLRIWPSFWDADVHMALRGHGWEEHMQALLDHLLQPQLNARGHVGAWLRIPPWWGSWTFGVPSEVEWVLDPLADALKALVLSLIHI